MKRRSFLKSVIGLSGVACLNPMTLALADHEHTPWLASGFKAQNGEFLLQIIDDTGQVKLSHSLPDRAHHIAAHPQATQLAVVARRPGTFIQVVDYQGFQPTIHIEAAPNRHFFGHAVFNASGSRLYATENNLDTDQGVIGVYETVSYRKIDEYSTCGIGPHELVWADENTLAIANGGILTRPEQGRKKLNLDTMLPSLVYISAKTGECSEQVFLDQSLHQLSIRHIAASAKGIVIGMQYQGDAIDQVPLVALHQRNNDIQFLSATDEEYRQLGHYCGSVKTDASGRYAAISSPVGGTVSIWDLHLRTLVALRKMRDGCGVCSTGLEGEFLVTSGTGRVKRYASPLFLAETVHKHQKFNQWDNHLTELS